jgi:hypothetical protein
MLDPNGVDGPRAALLHWRAPAPRINASITEPGYRVDLIRIRPLIGLVCALVVLISASSAVAGLKMYMGAAEDEGRVSDPAVARAKMELAKAAGFDTIRITAVWAPGQSAVPKAQLQALQEIAATGLFLNIRIVATIMNFGNRTTPLTATQRTQFAKFAADMVRRVPSIREYIIGNEPNLNRYWLPQFGSNGEDVAAPAYTRLLAETYDAIKRVDKRVFVNGPTPAATHTRRRRSSPTWGSPTAR